MHTRIVKPKHGPRLVVRPLRDAGELIADARAAGITHVTALVAGDNPAALALLRRAVEVLDIRFEGTELSVRAAIA